MRVPTNSNTEQMLNRISDLSSRQAKLQNQVATGQRIFQPEDDPSAVGRILTLNTEKSQLSQYDTNANYALDLSTATFSAINELKKISDRSNEIATLGEGAVSPDAFKAYASEINQLIEQSVQLGNSRLGNDFLFAGTALSTSPFNVTTRDADGQITAFTYDGETTAANVVSIPIAQNATLEPGADIATNQGVETFINHLISLRDTLNAGNSSALGAVRTNLESDENMIVNAMSAHGAIQMRIEVSQSQRTERLDNIDQLVSGEKDVDMPETITKLKQASIAYQAALQSAAKIMQISLLDYLR